MVNEEVTHEEQEVRGEFLDESLLSVVARPWFAYIAKYKATGVIPHDLNWNQRNKFLYDVHSYVWDDLHLFKLGADNFLRRCVTIEEA